MKNIIILLTAFLMMASSAIANTPNCDDASRYGEVSKQELTKLVETKSATIIDVNSEESYKESHVPTSVNYNMVKKDLAKVLPESKDSLVIAYCGGPSCTAWKKAAKDACRLGYTNVKHFKGGISGWKKGS